VEDSLIVKEIDNKAFSHGFLSQKTKFSLAKGEHAVVIKYKDVFEDLDFGEEELVESALFVAKFNSNDQDVITIKTPKIRNLKVAKHYVKMPEVIVTDSKNNKLSVEHQTYSEYKTEQEVSTVLAHIAKVTPNTIKTQPVQLAKKSTTAIVIAAKVNKVLLKEKKNIQSSNRMNSLSMLEYWWQQASDEEKLAFKQKIKIK